MRTIKSFLPVFIGFYNTIFEFNQEYEEIENYNMENDTELEYDDFNWDYEAYEKRVAQACVDTIDTELKELGIKVKMEKIVSPRFYNFTNDSINVEYELAEDSMQKLLDYIKEYRDEFDQYITDRYTSRSGFSSFYSNDSQVWLDEYFKDEDKLKHCFGSILEFYFQNEEYTYEDLYEEITDEVYWIEFTIAGEPTEEDLKEYKDISLTEK